MAVARFITWVIVSVLFWHADHVSAQDRCRQSALIQDWMSGSARFVHHVGSTCGILSGRSRFHFDPARPIQARLMSVLVAGTTRDQKKENHQTAVETAPPGHENRSESEENPTLLPSEAFRMAYQTFLKGQYRRAIVAFHQFIKQYPSSSMVDQAYFYLAESYVDSGDSQKAAHMLVKLVQAFPSSRLRPAALFKLGNILADNGQWERAKNVWSSLIAKFPQSPEAKLADQKIRAMSSTTAPARPSAS